MTMTDHAVSSLVQANLTLPTTLTQIGIALVMLFALWPHRRQAGELQRRWGVGEPTGLETDEALRYLRHRRLAYPGLYLVISLGTSLWLPEPPLIFAVLLAGGLLGEAIDWQRGRGATWVRTSAPRSSTAQRARALVPRWSFALAGVLLAAVALLIGAGLLGQAWALQVIPAPGIALLVGSAAGFAAVAVVWLAASRTTGRSTRTGAALWLRSARVAIALGMLALAAIGASGGSQLGFGFVTLGAGVIVTTAPVRRPGHASTEPSGVVSQPERCA
jgi:hypothetical protein